MDVNIVKIKENLTFYRRMANTNITIMRKYKSAVVNRMSYENILDIYINNNLSFKDDVERLKLFLTQTKKNTNDNLSETLSEPIEINTETSDCSEPTDINSDTYIENYENKSNIYSTNTILDKIVNKNTYDDFKIIMNSAYNYINNKYLIPFLIPVLISSIIYARRSQK
jgi:hypothetical protein